MRRKRKMIWMTLLALLVAVLVFVPLVGFLLPEVYRAQLRADVERPPAEVWAALVDFEAHSFAGAMRKGHERLPDEDGRPAWVEDLGSSRVRYRVTEWDPPRRLVVEGADEVVPMTARWVFTLEPTPAGTRLRSAQRITLRNGTWHVPIFRVMMSLFSGAERGLRDHAGRVLADLPATIAPEEPGPDTAGG
jgi:hypothetical protein